MTLIELCVPASVVLGASSLPSSATFSTGLPFSFLGEMAPKRRALMRRPSLAALLASFSFFSAEGCERVQCNVSVRTDLLVFEAQLTDSG